MSLSSCCLAVLRGERLELRILHGGRRGTIPRRGESPGIDGRRTQIRYKEEPFSAVTVNFERWPTYAYTDNSELSPAEPSPMPGVKGDPRQGRELFMARTKGPCTGCHLIPGVTSGLRAVWGPTSRSSGTGVCRISIFSSSSGTPECSYQHQHAPWGTAGILSPEEIVHIVAFLQTLKGNPPFVPPPETDPTRNPYTRPTVPSITATTWIPHEPGVLFAENGLATWSTRPGGESLRRLPRGAQRRR